MKAEDAILNVLLTARPGTIIEVRQPRAGKLEFTIEQVRAAIQMWERRGNEADCVSVVQQLSRVDESDWLVGAVFIHISGIDTFLVYTHEGARQMSNATVRKKNLEESKRRIRAISWLCRAGLWGTIQDAETVLRCMTGFSESELARTTSPAKEQK
jgi:hypothetical protein